MVVSRDVEADCGLWDVRIDCGMLRLMWDVVVMECGDRSRDVMHDSWYVVAD